MSDNNNSTPGTNTESADPNLSNQPGPSNDKPAVTADDYEGLNQHERSDKAQDALKYWTAQDGGMPVLPENVPGNVVTEAQLPDADVQRASGVDVEAYRAGLFIAADDAEKAVMKAEVGRDSNKDNNAESSSEADSNRSETTNAQVTPGPVQP